MSSQNSVTLFFTGMVIGGLVSAGLALLLVPQSGEETRAIIKDKSIELREGVPSRARKLIRSIRTKFRED